MIIEPVIGIDELTKLGSRMDLEVLQIPPATITAKGTQYESGAIYTKGYTDGFSDVFSAYNMQARFTSDLVSNLEYKATSIPYTYSSIVESFGYKTEIRLLDEAIPLGSTFAEVKNLAHTVVLNASMLSVTTRAEMRGFQRGYWNSDKRDNTITGKSDIYGFLIRHYEIVWDNTITPPLPVTIPPADNEATISMTYGIGYLYEDG
jgi:hypothetical protein